MWDFFLKEVLAIGLIINVVYWGLAYLMPAPLQPDVTISKATFFKHYVLTHFVLFASAIICTFLVYKFFIAISNKTDPNYLYDLYSDNGYGIIFALLIGGAFGIIATFGWIKLFLRENADMFWASYDTLYGFRATPLLKSFVFLFCVGGIVLLLLGKNAYFKINEKTMRISRFLDFSYQEYRMSEVSSIKHLHKEFNNEGTIHKKPYYEITFKDGYEWNSLMDLREAPIADDEKIFKDISKFAQIDIQEIN